MTQKWIEELKQKTGRTLEEWLRHMSQHEHSATVGVVSCDFVDRDLFLIEGTTYAEK